MKRRVISIGLVMLLVLSICILPASAGAIDDIQDIVVQTKFMNELSAQVALNSYFAQRLSYLSGTAEDITVVNRPMFSDEQRHKAFLEDTGIVLQASTPTIISIECWDNTATAIVQENAQFLHNGNIIEETIVHEITLCCLENNLILLQSDAYLESLSGFESCSYLSPEKLAAAEAEIMAVGSAVCICDKAASQQNNTNPTPYYDWYKTATGYSEHGNDWCAIFVAWCAAQSNISSATIPYTAWVPNFRTHYYNWNTTTNRYYGWQDQLNKKSQGQTYQWPQAGDIIFINGTANEPYHVGIICYVGNGTLYIADGNWNGKVNYRSLADTNSSIVAFARPNYQNYNHTVTSAWTSDGNYHWHACSACGAACNKEGHSIVWDNDYLRYRCVVCGYM